MTYQEAIIITKAFDSSSYKKSYEKTHEEMKTYAEACAFLKGIGG